ncbi:hypothetical protein MED16_gp22 [Pantoea phage vB_PagS_MED16]|nr:hypothetical protein MED16_gp22 [Pantoea phage vB_PagS_MED16]
MADYYGARITPDDGGKPLILDAYTRFMSNLANGVSLKGNVTTNQIKAPTVGAMPLIVPRKLVTIYPGESTPNMYWIESISLDAGGLLTHVPKGGSNLPVDRQPAEVGNVDVFSVDGGASPKGSYGVRITNGSNFMEINDTTYLGFVTYRAVVNINNTWDIPPAIVARGPYVVYARWDNTSTPLFLNRDNNRIECFTAFSNTEGSSIGGTVNNVMIVIISCAFVPDLPASGWGMVIRNAQGVVTFSSKYPPVIWRGGRYDFQFYRNFDTSSGEVLQWTDVSAPAGVSVAAPMIPLCSIGVQRGDYSRSGGTWTYRPVLYSGFKMSGNRVSSARAKSAGTDAPVTLNVKAMQVGCSIPCIDAADYF